MSWFNDQNYDLLYQQPVDSLALIGARQVIVAVQRSSTLIRIDADSNNVVSRIPLRDRGGNPHLSHFGPTDFMASDYDMLCRVSIGSWRVEASDHLQGPTREAVGAFIGDYTLTATGECVVPRPFSDDVLLLADVGFRILGRVSAPGQPLKACLLPDGRCVTRGWKTGQVFVTGQLRQG